MSTILSRIWHSNYVTFTIDPTVGSAFTYDLIVDILTTLVRLDIIEDFI